MYRFPWYLTLVSTNHASSNPGLVSRLEASRGTSEEYRVPWQRGSYVKTVVFLAEFFLAYKGMVCVRFLM